MTPKAAFSIPTCFIVATVLSIKVHAQAIPAIQARRIESVPAIKPTVTGEAVSDSHSKQPFTFRDNRIPPPLFVIDGKIANVNDGKIMNIEGLNSINPQDIEHILIVKGDSAIVRYGQLGINGAVVITTKNN
ncbi:TonB-dependent receptor plug domain-containing protein [Hymenobacter ruricola]|uniref:TonB-dependent receptor plug domain-containing protein n=1 Tax=Hymenobacter ruricola TaxID=2791023 RepID=A0ABS0HZZ4_9BACT|nr:TonB-dependent receptor plug domain-containing protein [Hymenobacter ruricola]MBF9220269.1 TonB-dependent receptor plug domain-containing protein [Hymenobacter ruricola]